MKKFHRFAGVTMAAMLLLTGCSGESGKEIDVAQTAADMITATTFQDEMRLMLEDVVSNKYDLTDVESYAVYMCPTGGYADEIAVFQAADGKAEAVEAAVNAHVEARKEEFDGYVAAEVFKLEQAEVVVNGNYVALIVADDTAPAAQVFADALAE